jgi:hypothetical protein
MNFVLSKLRFKQVHNNQIGGMELLKRFFSVLVVLAMLISVVCPQLGYAQGSVNNSSSVKDEREFLKSKERYKEDEIIVKFKKNVSAKEQSNSVKSVNADIKKTSSHGAKLIKLKEKNVEKYLKLLRANENIEYAEPNYLRAKESITSSIPNDPGFGNQWGLNTIGIQNAWNGIGQVSGEVTVAVIDEGVDMEHPDLINRIAPGGYDFVDEDNNPRPNPLDPEEQHGTHVAGIISAETNNSIGIAGTAGTYPVKILPLRVLAYGNGNDFDIAEAIKYAADKGVEVINMSLGGYGSSEVLEDAVEYALEKNVVVVAAAGNEMDNANYYSPANIDGVVTVSAVNNMNSLAGFSNYGTVVELAAPGVNILSSVPGARYESWDGTSMATPFVSGSAALLILKNPNFSRAIIEGMLFDSAKDLGASGRDSSFGYGLLDVNAALGQPLPDGKVQVLNLNDKEKVFGTFEIKVQYSRPEILSKIQVFADNGSNKIGEISGNASNSIYSQLWDTTSLTDGAHTLIVKAFDTSGKVSEDNVSVLVANNVVSGLRIKIIGENSNVLDAYVEVWHPYYYKDGSFDYDFVYGNTPDINGEIDISGAIAPNGNEYLVLAYYWKGDIPVLRAKKVKTPGALVLDEKDLVTVDINTNIADSQNYEILLNPLYEDGLSGKKYPLDLYLDLPILDEISKKTSLIVDAGKYDFMYIGQGWNQDDTISKGYFLSKPEVLISKVNNTVNFDGNIDNLSKVKINLDNSKDYFESDGFYGISNQNSYYYNGWYVDTSKDYTFYITPGNYRTIYTAFTKDNNMIDLMTPSKSFAKGNIQAKYGGDLSGKMTLNKQTYLPGEYVSVKTEIKDSYNNILDYVYSDEYLMGISEYNKQDFLIKKASNGKKKVCIFDMNKKRWSESNYIKSSAESTLKVYDSTNKAVITTYLEDFHFNELYLNQDFPGGDYRAVVSMDTPKDLNIESRFKVDRNSTTNGLKIKINRPNNEEPAEEAYISLYDLNSKRVYYPEEGYDLVNGEMFISKDEVPSGNYRMSVYTWTNSGEGIAYVEDVKIPGSYELNPEKLKKVRLYLKADNGIDNLSDVSILFSKSGTNVIEDHFGGYIGNDHRDVYIQKGTYNFSAIGNGNYGEYMRRLIVKPNVTINDSTNEITFSSNDLVEVTLNVDMENSGIDYFGLTNKNFNVPGGVYDLYNGEKFKVSKGNYIVRENIAYLEGESQVWWYDYKTDKNITANTSLSVGNQFNVKITSNKAAYSANEVLHSDNVIEDQYGNRLTYVDAYDMSEWEILKSTLKSSKGLIPRQSNGQLKLYNMNNFEKQDYLPSNHWQLSPFITIINSLNNKMVYNNKSYQYYESSDIKLDSAWAANGKYKVELSLGVSVNGTIKGSTNIAIGAVDVTLPVVKIADPTKDIITKNDNYTLKGTLSEVGTVYLYKVIGEEQEELISELYSADKKFNFSVDLDEGINKFRVKAIDNSGNQSKAEAANDTRTITCDTKKPVIKVDDLSKLDTRPAKEGIQVINNKVNITGSISDEVTSAGKLKVKVGTITVKLDNEGDFSLSLALKTGVNEFTILAEDEAGNVISEGPTKITLLETTPPDVKIDDPNKDITTRMIDYTIRGSVNEPATVYLYRVLGENQEQKVSEQYITNKKFIFQDVDLFEGTNKFRVEAIDDSENKSKSNAINDTRIIICDTEAPVVDLNTVALENLDVKPGKDGIQVESSSISITGKITDEITSYLKLKVSIGTSTVKLDSEGRFNHKLSLRAGINVFPISARDEIGNVQQVGPLYITLLEKVSPEVKISDPNIDIVTKNDNYTIKGSVSELAVVTLYRVLENGEKEVVSETYSIDKKFNFSVNLNPGINKFKVEAVDDSDNVSKDNAKNDTRIIICDTEAPVLSNLLVNDSNITGDILNVSGSKLTIKGSIIGDEWETYKDYKVLINGKSATVNSNKTFNYSLTLSKGKQVTVTVKVLDKLGNESESVTVNVIYN